MDDAAASDAREGDSVLPADPGAPSTRSSIVWLALTALPATIAAPSYSPGVSTHRLTRTSAAHSASPGRSDFNSGWLHYTRRG
jgi:hypothetical protein